MRPFLFSSYVFPFFSTPDFQKFGSGVGTLPQLEPPVVQVVVSNAKNQHQQSDNILPQIANKGGQNNYTVSLRMQHEIIRNCFLSRVDCVTRHKAFRDEVFCGNIVNVTQC